MSMTPQRAAEILRRHNEWRRGADNNHWQQSPYSPAELGQAIDAAVAALENTTQADAALADELDAIADDLKQPYCAEIRKVAAALRASQPAQAVAEGCKHENPTPHYDHLRCQCGAFMTDSQWGAASNKWFPSKEAALLAASKGGAG